ncbi:MutS family DNA mismatch repair protein [Pendulispora brunnea]|uniref:MutS family DNA mismatch repair protein n=1 Tax=Pendulispora brunnea TaxID=2905690 RepID=A0ABZ2KFD3_9BACT
MQAREQTAQAAQQPRDVYEAGKAARTREIAALETRSRSMGLFTTIAAVAAVVFIGCIVWVPLPSTFWGVEFLLVLSFVALWVGHGRLQTKKDLVEAALRFHERGLARLEGKWNEHGASGEEFSTPNHPYAGDLDIFGPNSLYRFLNLTETRFGSAHLAAWLKGAANDFPNGVRERQEAARDLAGRHAFREGLSATGAILGEEKPDPEPFLTWAAGATPLEASPVLVLAAKVLPILTVASLVFAKYLPSGIWIGLLILQLILVSPKRGVVARIVGSVNSMEGGFSRFAEMLAAVEGQSFEASSLVQCKARLASTGTSATHEMGRLGRILSFVGARENAIFRLVIGPLLLWDFNCAVALERWRLRAGTNARTWLSTLGEVEALCSFAALAHDHPEFAWPTLSNVPHLDAKALGHPLIVSTKRVDNDVLLEHPGSVLLVTGSNMSGKSTLLRAIGINAVLALAGAPVCAQSLVIGDLRVATSMRVRDSLAEGVSHFYAELQRLKMVVDMSRGDRTVLFLLDEILHGTNTRERLIGARSIVRKLVLYKAMGAVSTHDLGIADLENELPHAVKNVHFQEQVTGDKMTFDYKLREGVVQSSNALILMKLVGLDIADAPQPAQSIESAR